MSKDKDSEWIEKSGGYEWTPGSPWPPNVPDYIADVDDQRAHHFQHSDYYEEACNGDDYQHSKMSGESAKYSPQHSDYYYDYNRNDPDRENPFTEAFDHLMAESVTGKTPWIYESPDGGKTVYRYERGTDPLKRELVEIPMADVDDQRAHHFSTNTSKKYQEDIGLKDLGEYVDTTYGGHYTSNDNNVQTLDIIESVGDAKSFCRSNAIKYLTRYDKKGQAKRDILKAAHYCLLLYYFDGHTNTN